MPDQMTPTTRTRRGKGSATTAEASARYERGRKALFMEQISELEVARIKEVVHASEGAAIVIRAEALLGGEQRTDLEIAITTDLAPSMAIALLATTAKARASRDDLDPALDCLVADASVLADQEVLRLKLLFDKGAVLPVEMPLEAGVRLAKKLETVLGGVGRSRA